MKDSFFHIQDWQNAIVEKYPNANFVSIGGGRHEAITPHNDELVGNYSVIRGGGWIK